MRRKKFMVIGAAALIVIVLAAVLIEAFIMGRSAPLGSVPSTQSTVGSEVSTTSQIVIVLEKETPQPSPQSNVGEVESASSNMEVSPELSSTPTPGVKTSNAPVVTPKPTEKPTVTNPPDRPGDPVVTPPPPTSRPIINEETPKPTQKPPEVTEISLDTYSVEILTGDSWRINIRAAPESVYSAGATWNTSNSSVIDLVGADLSGVTIKGKSPGTAKVTIYSKNGLFSATCNVSVQ